MLRGNHNRFPLKTLVTVENRESYSYTQESTDLVQSLTPSGNLKVEMRQDRMVRGDDNTASIRICWQTFQCIYHMVSSCSALSGESLPWPGINKKDIVRRNRLKSYLLARHIRGCCQMPQLHVSTHKCSDPDQC